MRAHKKSASWVSPNWVKSKRRRRKSEKKERKRGEGGKTLENDLIKSGVKTKKEKRDLKRDCRSLAENFHRASLSLTRDVESMIYI